MDPAVSDRQHHKGQLTESSEGALYESHTQITVGDGYFPHGDPPPLNFQGQNTIVAIV